MPTDLMSNHFRYYLRVRYGECDAQKVVFNARYAEYVDLATTEFLRALGYGEQLFSGELDFQLVKQTIEWKAPARFDQVLEVSVLQRASATLHSPWRPNFALPATTVCLQLLKPFTCWSNSTR
jgi:hypothetical protein